MQLVKFAGNPIVSPRADRDWESLSTCNPGAWYGEGEVTLLYRAAGSDAEHRIVFGLAKSKDGYHFERVGDRPVFEPAPNNFDGGCVEDPRLVKFGESFFVTYAFRPFPPGRYWLAGGEARRPKGPSVAPDCWAKNLTNSGLAITEDLKSFIRLGRITKAGLDDRDAILFPEKIRGRYAMLHRPSAWVGKGYGTQNPGIWLSYSDDLLSWGDDRLLAKGEEPWENAKIGGGCPPIKTDAGWLVIYHGVDTDRVYRAGAMLLDIEEPHRILGRTKSFILEPTEDYERCGLVENVVFPVGAAVMGETLFVYYGAADKYCCVATAPLRTVLAAAAGNA